MKRPMILIPDNMSEQLAMMVNSIITYGDFDVLGLSGELPDLCNCRLVLAVQLNHAGNCNEIYEFLNRLQDKGAAALAGTVAILLIHSPNELNTKSNAANIAFQMNQLGCSFIGHPLVEATGSLQNFLTWQKTIDKPLSEICIEICSMTAKRFIECVSPTTEHPNILVLHSSSKETSNTLALWAMIKAHITDCEITELHVGNGRIKDCKGCSFTTCAHYSSRHSCFYGGTMVEDIYPAIEKADTIVWLCPNYNDSVSANLMAVINRLTALYRRTPFYNKSFFSVIVSGNSGGDSVAKQLIDSLCINKGFYLPAYSSLFATANDPGSIHSIPDIEALAESFAFNIMGRLKNTNV